MKMNNNMGTGKRNTPANQSYRIPKKSILKKEVSTDKEVSTPSPNDYFYQSNTGKEASKDAKYEKSQSIKTNVNSDRDTNRQLMASARKSKSRLS